LWTLNTPSRVRHDLTVHTDVKRVHPQCVDVAIREIASAEDDLLETDVRSVRRVTGATVRH
jgi:hypothetical protein